MGQPAYPEATRLLITADAGGSNGSRLRLWKVELQKLADETGLRIAVCHFPPGTSKWNKIEHRLFSYITQNWRGHPLRSFQAIFNLIAERRAGIEAAVAREAGDLAALAECAALPSEHPLRKAASALQRAFLAVIGGPVGEEAVELPEVSHRSPLAPWKLLVRAIACFYRREDEACRRYLEAIKPEAAAARLVPAMQAMLGGKP